MAYIPAMDCSQWNGTINWPKVTEKIAMIKMGGGDAGLYLDSAATKNYYGAKAAGKAVGGYWFAGGTDPVKEADYFIRAMSPLALNDVFALDWEVSHINPVQWCLQFVTEVHVKTGCWPLLYINESTCNAYDWSPVLKTCGLWVADYAVLPTATVPVKHVYVMHQYTNQPYDKDAWFGTVAQFKAYGYKGVPKAATAPAPTAPTTVLGKIGATLPTPAPEPGTVVEPAPPVGYIDAITTPDEETPVKQIPVEDKSEPEPEPGLLARIFGWLRHPHF